MVEGAAEVEVEGAAGNRASPSAAAERLCGSVLSTTAFSDQILRSVNRGEVNVVAMQGEGFADAESATCPHHTTPRSVVVVGLVLGLLLVERFEYLTA